ncbi:MAG: hypothetical protein AAGL89_07335 [Pseudomonadota bacterium]
MIKPFFLAAVFSAMSLPALAQAPSAEEARVNEIAAQLELVMTGLEERAEGYPAFIEELQAGLVTIERADEEVGELIAQLTAATDQMDDQSDFDAAIDEYRDATVALIAEAEGSNNEAIKAAIPDLEASLEELNASDDQRAETVIEARNLIRSLEQNREAIAFFIRAGQVQRATALIQQNVDEFAEIVENGKALAGSLTPAANP